MWKDCPRHWWIEQRYLTIPFQYEHQESAWPPHMGDFEAARLARRPDNGRITCAEARRHGIAPVHSDHPAYAFMRDGDGDGVVCE